MSRVRAILRDVVESCRPSGLAEAHREIERMNQRYADVVVGLARAEVAIKRVMEIHKPTTQTGWTRPRCVECETTWPCATSRALGQPAKENP